MIHARLRKTLAFSAKVSFNVKRKEGSVPIPRPFFGRVAYFFSSTVFTAFDTDLVVKPFKQPVSS